MYFLLQILKTLIQQSCHCAYEAIYQKNLMLQVLLHLACCFHDILRLLRNFFNY
uniref:Uncharacterized protein n=1 Tax=Arundo donax TaxID=35708 RepID=A0A0A9HLD2_ARUDO